MEQKIIVDDEVGKVRIDRFLVKKSENMTRGEIIRMIKAGHITVNSSIVKPSYTVKSGDIIEFVEYEDESDKIIPNKNINLDIIESNSDFVVINKQIGLQVHPSHREREKTLVNALLAHFPEITDVGDDVERPGIMHRLDKDTTGLIVIAKNQDTFDNLKSSFQDRTVQKTYHALIFGIFDKKEGIIDAPIARAASYTRQKIAVGKFKGDAREAQTKYKVLKEYHISDTLEMSLIEVQPKTGRTHQIRVHMAYKGHPLVGDNRYYTKIQRKTSLKAFEEYDPSTFYLHAKELHLHINEEEYNFKAEYPDRFRAILHYLEAFVI